MMMMYCRQTKQASFDWQKFGTHLDGKIVMINLFEMKMLANGALVGELEDVFPV